jgi:pSer/pThr/pTyr-binding forkhead associated (FHA) protein
VKSYLLSWLARKHAATDLEAFERQLPGPWLVWEAGPWCPPPQDRATLHAVPRGRPASGEALVLEVAPRVGQARLAGVRVGRGPENDLVVDDGTLSREHFLLRPAAEAWTLEDMRSSNGSRVNGVPVNGPPVPVPVGARIEAGAVTFTFLDTRGLHQRMRRVIG